MTGRWRLVNRCDSLQVTLELALRPVTGNVRPLRLRSTTRGSGYWTIKVWIHAEPVHAVWKLGFSKMPPDGVN